MRVRDALSSLWRGWRSLGEKADELESRCLDRALGCFVGILELLVYLAGLVAVIWLIKRIWEAV